MSWQVHGISLSLFYDTFPCLKSDKTEIEVVGAWQSIKKRVVQKKTYVWKSFDSNMFRIFKKMKNKIKLQRTERRKAVFQDDMV